MKNNGLLAEQLQRKRKLKEKLAVNVTASQQRVIDGLVLYLTAKGKNSNTIARYDYSLRRFLQFAGEGFEFEKATKEDLQRIISRINASGLAPVTTLKINIHVKFLYKWLMGDPDVPHNYPSIVAWIKTSGSGKSKLVAEDLITEEEVNKMINAADNLRDKAVMAVLYDTGVRAGEILNMKIKDVHLENDPAFIIVDGKTGMRRIPIYFSAPYLAQYIDSIKEYTTDSPLWIRYINRYGMKKNHIEAIDGNGLRKILHILAGRAGINRHLWLHLFRHSRASYYANRLTEPQLRAFFGWTMSSRTPSTYIHMSGRDLDDAVAIANGKKPKESIAPQATELKCPRCKRDSPLTANHCFVCGADLHISQIDIVQDKAYAGLAKELYKNLIKNPEILRKLLNLKDEEKEDLFRLIK